MEGDWLAMVKEQEQHALKKKPQNAEGATGLEAKVNSLNVADEKKSATGQQDSKEEASQAKKNGADSEEKEVTVAEASLMTKVLRTHLTNVKSEVEVLQRDPNSPLYSAKTFEELDLNDDLLKGVYDMGFNKPSKIQETALPMLLAYPPSNMIAQSQSGTGKTAAFVLSMLSRVDVSKPYPQALLLSPTFELARQTGSVLSRMGKYLMEKGLKVDYALKGQRVPRGEKSQCQVVIGTPGTVLDWLLKYRRFDAKKISIFVLDEADVMISTQGHQDQSIRIRRNLGKDCQLLLFSATYDQEVMNFASSIVQNPVVIRLRREEESLDNIKQFYVNCESEEKKYEALANLYGVLTIGQSMVFCHTKRSASWLAGKMTKDGHAVGLLTGELEIEQRLATLNRFRDGKEKLLITTNVCARGIDVEQVTIVVNYDIPVNQSNRPDFETYLHRIGRTGRFGKKGLAINFVDGTRSMNMVKQISEHFKKPINRLVTDDLDELEKLESFA
ncbi:ATP-dependent RNA helicase DDX19A-like [Rhopilema esculentum]|uniref:ATP-dependent RNA helicase DDX19A-like n=1 Tax=Rhopilema esculentum TaxID=499914 RepID=UPI0031CEB793|eukprot:gene7228-12911_t